MRELAPEASGRGLRIAVAVSRFHETVTRRLLEGCLGTLRELGVADADMTVAWVPGSFELPAAALRLAEAGADAVVALGCVLRGETEHHEHVAREAIHGLAEVARQTGVPVALGVITAETHQQAIDRSGGHVGHRGADAARSAVEMACLLRRIR